MEENKDVKKLIIELRLVTKLLDGIDSINKNLIISEEKQFSYLIIKSIVIKSRGLFKSMYSNLIENKNRENKLGTNNAFVALQFRSVLEDFCIMEYLFENSNYLNYFEDYIYELIYHLKNEELMKTKTIKRYSWLKKVSKNNKIHSLKTLIKSLKFDDKSDQFNEIYMHSLIMSNMFIHPRYNEVYNLDFFNYVVTIYLTFIPRILNFIGLFYNKTIYAQGQSHIKAIYKNYINFSNDVEKKMNIPLKDASNNIHHKLTFSKIDNSKKSKIKNECKLLSDKYNIMFSMNLKDRDYNSQLVSVLVSNIFSILPEFIYDYKELSLHSFFSKSRYIIETLAYINIVINCSNKQSKAIIDFFYFYDISCVEKLLNYSSKSKFVLSHDELKRDDLYKKYLEIVKTSYKENCEITVTDKQLENFKAFTLVLFDNELLDTKQIISKFSEFFINEKPAIEYIDFAYLNSNIYIHSIACSLLGPDSKQMNKRLVNEIFDTLIKLIDMVLNKIDVKYKKTLNKDEIKKM